MLRNYQNWILILDVNAHYTGWLAHLVSRFVFSGKIIVDATSKLRFVCEKFIR